MQSLFWLLTLAILVTGLLYTRHNLKASTVAVAAFLAIWSWSGSAGGFIQFLAWTVFAAAAVFLNVKPLRRQFMSAPVFAIFKKILPKMSDTERDALEAGNVWWDAELFSGKPDWQKLLNTPPAQLSVEEQNFIDGPTQILCDMLDDWKITHETQDLPKEVWDYIKENKFFGMIIPTKYGGLGFSAFAHSSVVMKIAGRSITGAVSVMVPNSLGPAELLLRYGTEEQKQHYLPRLALGKEIPCFALTSPEAGSDAAAMTDTGIVCKGEFEGKSDVLGIRLNWEKRYITLGPVATVLGLAFKLYDPDHLIGEREELGITCALIPTNTAGVEIGRRHFPLNSAFQNGPNSGKDVFIPIDWIIGGQSQAGKGWRMLMECLAAGRSISLPALSTGGGKLVSRATGAYARVRQQFKIPVGKFEGVEEALARIAAGTYRMDAARCLTASAIDQGNSPSVISAIVKYNLTETMRQCVNDAMDVQGGSGICMGPRNYLARAYQSLPISITVEGANILTRSLIIFGQGAIRCHPYVLKEMTAVRMEDQKEALAQFDDALWGHIGFTASNKVRTLVLAFSASRIAHTPVSDRSAIYYKHLTRISSSFALIADVSMAVLGGNLKRMEKLSARLADVLSHMYLMSACLKRFHDDGCPEDDWPLLQWNCENSLRIMQQSLDKFINNFPNRSVAWILRRIVFPFGKPFRGPSDRLGAKLASLLMSPSQTRDRLTHGMYMPDLAKQDVEPLARLEAALTAVIAADASEKKLRAIMAGSDKIFMNREEQLAYALSQDEFSDQDAETIRNADRLRREVIMVDDFDSQELRRQTSNDIAASSTSDQANASAAAAKKNKLDKGDLDKKECA